MSRINSENLAHQQMFLKGITLGVSIAAPVGPIGLLCIRRTLAQGVWAGLLTGLGAATADALYGCVAGFGLTAISDLLVRHRFWLQLVGGVFLCYLGYQTFRSKPPDGSAEATPVRLLPAYGSTLVLTLANPLTILSFAAVFAGFGLGTTAAGDYRTACKLVVGVFAGSALWWLLLSGVVGVIRGRINPDALRWVNRISGALLLAFGVYVICQI